jgi:putative SOS response-associated peptidase YedK
MCYSNSSTSKNVSLSRKYGKSIPPDLNESPVYFASGFTFPLWRVVTSDKDLRLMQWGLIPSWFKDGDPNKIAAKTLNAKIETVTEKASFRSSVGRRNCVIPSSGFFEWQTQGKLKVPYFLKPANDFIFSMAGIYDEWVDRSTGEIIPSFSILTCPANDLMEEIHNSKKRMPVLLNGNQIETWIQGDIDPLSFILPFPSDQMKAVRVKKSILLSLYPNVPEVQEEISDLNGIQGSLF